MKYQEKSTLSFPDDTMLPEVYTDTIVCIYNVDGKCNGMLTPERLNILRKAFDRVKCSGLHDHVQPHPISFASELVGLIARKDTSFSKYTNTKNLIIMVTIGGDLQPGCLADRLLTGLGQPQINP